MYGIVYGDFLAHLIVRLDGLLQSRPELYAAGVEVSDQKSAASRRAVVLTTSPGGGTGNTLRTSYVTVDVITDDQGTTADLIEPRPRTGYVARFRRDGRRPADHLRIHQWRAE